MSIPAHERLLDLIIALARARPSMTRSQIRRHVNGYAPASDDPRAEAAFERMFERDKETLKDLGVPLVTVHGTVHHDEVGYRIDVEEYTLPPVEFTSAELGVLSVASHLWEGSALARHARRGLTKLKAVTLTPAEENLTPAVRLHEPDAALPVLFEAITTRHAVAFTYRAASSGQETDREVEPWGLAVKNQGWYLRGWDRTRGAGREFRLSRITSKVRLLPETGGFTGPDPGQITGEADLTRVRLAIRPEAAALLRARGEPAGTLGERDLIELRVSDLEAFAGDIAAYGAAVEVLHPQHLRERVITKLTALSQAPGPEGLR